MRRGPLSRRLAARALVRDLLTVAADGMNAAANSDITISGVLIDPIARTVTLVPLGGQTVSVRLISLLCQRGTIVHRSRAPLDGPRVVWLEGTVQPSPGLSVLVRMMVSGGDAE